MGAVEETGEGGELARRLAEALNDIEIQLSGFGGVREEYKLAAVGGPGEAVFGGGHFGSADVLRLRTRFSQIEKVDFGVTGGAVVLVAKIDRPGEVVSVG